MTGNHVGQESARSRCD